VLRVTSGPTMEDAGAAWAAARLRLAGGRGAVSFCERAGIPLVRGGLGDVDGESDDA